MTVQTGRYCKAYYLKDLRAFTGWQECSIQNKVLMDDSIVYLHDNYTVSAGVYQNTELLFTAVTEEWKAFCTNILAFNLPE